MIIKHHRICRMCQCDSKASTVTSYTRFSTRYDITVLALLSHRHVWHMAGCLIIAWWGKSIFYLIFLINTTMLWIKPMRMCLIIACVYNMKIFIISIVSFKFKQSFIKTGNSEWWLKNWQFVIAYIIYCLYLFWIGKNIFQYVFKSPFCTGLTWIQYVYINGNIFQSYSSLYKNVHQ